MKEYIIAIIAATGGAVVSFIGGLILRAIEKKERKREEDNTSMAGIRILLYDRIKHLGKAYINRGSITAEELEDLIAMHKIYHENLKGNGFLDKIMAAVHELPIKN